MNPATLFKMHRRKRLDDTVFWRYVTQTGFWTERDHDSKTMFIFFPETGNALSKQEKLLSYYDWLWNFLVIPLIGVHVGFLVQHLSRLRKMRTMIKAFKPRKIYAVGYSQGGGNGLISAGWMKRKKYDVEYYSYGAPRTFGLVWTIVLTILGLKHCRVVNGSDLVTKVPFLAMGFTHHGRVLRIGKSKVLWSTTDHYPDEYTRNLEKMFPS